MNITELVKKRYSVRDFSDKPIPEDDITKILEAGMVCPTATNAQPQRIIVLQTPEAIKKIRGLTRMAFNAPVVFMVCFDTDKSWKATSFGDNYDAGQTDADIVTTVMMLKAEELGIGTLWARGFNGPEIEKAFNFPKNLKLACLLDLGYPSEKSQPSERHTQRLPLSETVSYL